jgi:fused signal recognition particle receptor
MSEDHMTFESFHHFLTTMLEQEFAPYFITGISVVVALMLLVLIAKKTKKPEDKKQVQASISTESTAKMPAVDTKTIVDEIKETDQATWRAKLQAGLTKTRDQFKGKLSAIFTGKDQISEDLLEQLHEALFRSDLGIETTDKLVDHVRNYIKLKEQPYTPTWEDIEAALAEKTSELLKQHAKPFKLQDNGPTVVLVVGVNGVGKTTSIGKLAAHYLAQDKKVLLAAADTYRAGAIDQLQVWADRLHCDLVKHKPGADPASVAYDSVKAAISRDVDLLIIDTAGRLHNKRELMDELAKIRRVVAKDLPNAPHETLIVIDATTGQNAFQQLRAFSEVVPLTGLIVTKLDGTAKGGVVVGASDKYKLPIQFIGVGEKASDLRAFNPEDFSKSLF